MIIFLLNLFACGEKSPDTGDSRIDTEDTAVSTETIDPCAPLEDLQGIGMNGTIVFEDGTEAKGNVRVQMCNSATCYVARWNDEGFCFPEGTLQANTPYAFDLVPTADSTKYANPLTFLTPTETFSLSEPVVIPTFTHQGPGNQDFDAGNGLTISASESMPETMYAVSIDLESGGLPFDEIEKDTILSAWYLGPFDTHLEVGSTITITDSRITAGSTYTIYNGDYETQSWIQTASITALDDGVISIENGLQIISTLLLQQ